MGVASLRDDQMKDLFKNVRKIPCTTYIMPHAVFLKREPQRSKKPSLNQRNNVQAPAGPSNQVALESSPTARS
jgi:hypothetical protein